ncbi:hypothetical protein [Lewinella sp. 4G2]|uniref:gliding motility protein GldB-related protein n=1 Tax=Lewinella sp. 4G2 TaxID=1803372 RepID=UPI0007B45CD4|nr:hypothetical protein [Lewinella sp. 4G2]OAV43849.1 hypothetical protein A3850_004755 [Lewinella sp. 4G2]
MIKIKVVTPVVAGLFCLLLSACTRDSAPVPDVSEINVDVTLIRFDEAVFDVDTNQIATELNRLDAEYGNFADLYLRNIMPVRRADFDAEEQIEVMAAMLRYRPLRVLDSLVSEKFDDAEMDRQVADLEQALRYYRHYLPTAEVPDTLTTFVSEFGYAALMYGENDLAAGLEFYLGPEFDYTQVSAQESIFSEYLRRTYRPEYLTQKLMQVVIDDRILRPRAGRLIDYLIYEGKKLYLLERVLPYAEETQTQEVTEEQLEWLRNNEIAIYANLQKEDQLYSTDQILIRKLTQPAPYTQGMPTDSPGRAVNYLGKRIIQAYVEANPQTTMEQLIAIEDGQKILAGARYKPR